MTVILGIDPGSRTCGYGLVRASGNRLEHLDSGVIRLEKLDFPERLKKIYLKLSEVIEFHQPQAAAVEEVFLGKNASSAIKLGQARGAAIVACTMHDMEVAEYATRKIKQALVGTGSAGKHQMQHMVRTLLGLKTAPAEDSSDALAVAICHAHTQQILIKMAGVRSSRRRRLRG